MVNLGGMKQQRSLGPALFLALFLAALAAGCAGSGTAGPGTLPSSPNDVSGDHVRRHHVGATLRLRIPRRPKRHGRGAHYVSAFTQSLTVGVQLVSGPSLPTQTLVVATPEPCQVSAGVTTCTFNVSAYVGQNVFTFNEYASKNPTPTDTPLATLTSPVTTVAAGSSLNFDLDGVVNKVVLKVPAPESTLTPVLGNTEAIPIGAPASFPLTVSAFDAAGGAIATDTFSSPITISVAAGAAPGVTLSLIQLCPNDAATTSQVTLTCSKDLTGVRVRYDGTVTRSGSGYLESASITAAPQPAVSSVPASIAFASNVVAYEASPGPASGPVDGVDLYNMALDPTSGKLVWIGNATGLDPALFEIDPAQPAAGVANLPLGFNSNSVAVDPNGHIWVSDVTSAALHCFASITTTTPVTVALTNNGSGITANNVVADPSGNIWFTGESGSGYQSVGFGPNACSATTFSKTFLIGAFGGAPSALSLASASGTWSASVDSPAGLYNVTTATAPSSMPSPVASWTPTVTPYSMTNDQAYNAYAAVYDSSSSRSVVTEIPSATSTIQTFSTLQDGTYPLSIAQFSSAGGSAKALAVSDEDYPGLFLISPAASTTEPLPIPMNGNYCFSVNFDANGDAWASCGRPDDSIWAYHTILTSTWSALPNQFYFNDDAPQSGLIGIVSNSPSSSDSYTATVTSGTDVIAIATPWADAANYPHSIPISILGTGSATLTILDNHGRSQTVTIQVAQGVSAGGRHRHPHRHPQLRKPPG
jgi:hypothetical protein